MRMFRRLFLKYKLHCPCWLTHYYAGNPVDNYTYMCIKCLIWKYPELHVNDKKLK